MEAALLAAPVSLVAVETTECTQCVLAASMRKEPLGQPELRVHQF